MKGTRRDPKRLGVSEAEADAELKRALSALALERPSPEELARVQRRLEHVFNQPRPARFEIASKLTKLTWLRNPQLLVLAATALLAGVWMMPQPQRVLTHRESAPPSAAQPRETRVATAPQQPTKSEPEAVLQQQQPSPESPHAGLPVPETTPEPQQEAARPHRSHPHQTAHASKRLMPAAPTAPTALSVQPAAPTSALSASPSPTPARTSTDSETAAALAPAQVEAAPQQDAAAQAPRALAPARSADEVTLLQRARHNAGADPQAALRFLDEHKRRFLKGTLAPEREVLAIELLRALSRKDEADRRAEAFQRDFPGSVYLPRVLH